MSTFLDKDVRELCILLQKIHSRLSSSGEEDGLDEIILSFKYALNNGVSGNEYIFVNDLSKLEPLFEQNNEIHLEDNKTYFFTKEIDLMGKKLIGGVNTTLLGASSENSVITSTGLPSGVPIFQSSYTTPIRHISFKDIDTSIYINGAESSEPVALDWTGVNFINVPNIGEVSNIGNFIFSKGAFLNSKNLVFDGESDTIGFDNSLFSSDGVSGDLIKIKDTASVNRRFRIVYSSVVSFGDTGGINVSDLSSIENDTFILDTVNFSGGGEYLPGLDESSNKSRFVNCNGIENSADIANYYWHNNSTETVISSTGVPVKVVGAPAEGDITRKFIISGNRATYVGSLDKFFKVLVTLSADSGNNNQVGVYIAKNGSVISESESYGTTGGNGRTENIVCQTPVKLKFGDYIEIFTENNTTTQDITITDINVIID